MHRISLLSLKRPLVSIFIVALISFFSFIGVARITFDDGLRTAFAGQSEAYERYEAHRRNFTLTENQIVVLFSAADLTNPEILNRLRAFSLEAALAPNVVDVLSIFSLRRIDADGEVGETLLPGKLAGGRNLSDLLGAVRNHPLGGARLLADDRKSTVVVVSLDPDRSETGPARETLQEIRKLAEESVRDTGLRYALTGLPPIRQSVLHGMLGDLVVLNLVGIVLGSAVCFAALRAPVLALLTGLPAGIALLWVLGMMGWFGLKINTLTNAIPVLVLVLALADSLHMTFETRRQFRASDQGSTDELLGIAARRIVPACALTSFTTALAFSALLISDSELVRSLGFAGALATLLSLLAVISVHPVVFWAAARMEFVRTTLRDKNASHRWLFDGYPLARMALFHPRAISAASIAMLFILLGIFSLVSPRYSFLENIYPSDPAMRALSTIQEKHVPTGSIDIPVKLAEGRLSKSDIVSLQRIHRKLAEVVPEKNITSIISLLNWVGSEAKDGSPQVLSKIIERMSKVQREQFLSSDHKSMLIRIYVPDNGARETKALVAQAMKRLRESEAEVVRIGAPTGLQVMSAQVALPMIEHLNLSFVVAVAAAGIFISLWFASVPFGMVAIVTNILPIACIGAWLYLSGRGLQFSSVIALTIAFGIAVDDTIHVLNQLRLARQSGARLSKDVIDEVFRTVSPVLVITTAVLAIGMLGTQLASIPTISYFGSLVIIIFAIALLAVLIVLPALLSTLISARWETDQ